MNPAEIVGRWMMFRFRRRVERVGREKVLRQLKKQGFPLPIIRVLLDELPVLTDVIRP